MADSDDEGTANAPSTLLTPLFVNLAISLIVLLLFSWASRRFSWCYQPRLARPDACDTRKSPPRLNTAAPWAWMRDVFNLSERALLETVGLDATMYLRFYQLGLKFFTPVSVFGLVVLMPLNLNADPVQVGDEGYSESFSLNQLTVSNIRKQSSVYWAHFLFVYASTFYLGYLLYNEYAVYVRLRHKYHLRPRGGEIRPEQRSVMVQKIPLKLQSETAFHEYMQNLYPNSFKSSVIVNDYSVLQMLFDEREAAKNSLETAVVAKQLSPDGKVPMIRPSWFGSKENAIEYWSRKIERLNNSIERCLSRPFSPTSSGFVSFTHFESVAAASQILQTVTPNTLQTRMAPEPRDVYWKNLRLTSSERSSRAFVVSALMFFLIAFWSVPVAFISALSKLEELQQTFPILNPVLDYSPALKGFLQGFLPSIALLLFQLLLPPLLLFLSRFEGFESLSWLEHSVFSKFFLFQFFAFFLVSVISGSLLSTLEQFFDNPSSIPALLSEGLAGQATPFTAYIILQTFSALPLRLMRIAALVVGLLKLKFSVSTPHQAKLATDPEPFKFGVDYPMQLFVFLLGLVYAPISPLILPFAVFFFFFGSIIFRFLLCFVHGQEYESGGRLFPKVFSRIMVGVIVSHLTLIGLFGLREAAFQSSLLVPLPILSFIFYLKVEARFGEVAERLCRDEVLELDQHLKLDLQETQETSSAYQPLCKTESTMNVRQIQEQILKAIPAVKQLPDTDAIRDLVVLDTVSQSDVDVDEAVSSGVSRSV